MFNQNEKVLEELLTKQRTLMLNQQAILDRLKIIETYLGLPASEATKQHTVTANKEKHDSINENQIKQKEQGWEPIPVLHNKPISVVHNERKSDESEVPTSYAPSIVEKENLEFKIGGTWLNRLGAGTVILGLSYFLKYSFDNQWIGPIGRVLLGIIFGIVLLGMGEKLREKYSLYAQGLVGAGSLALYFSVYAGYNFYQLISPAVAFIFLIIVMVNTVTTAIRYDALTIGVLGIVGGYGAPLLISTGTPQPLIFFGYLTLLTCGILGVSVYKRWDLLRIISFIFNQILLAIWVIGPYQPRDLVITIVFVLVNFIAYLAIASVYNIKVKSMINPVETALVALNSLAFFMWSHWLLQVTFLKDYMGFYALVIALAYTFIGRLAHRLHAEDKRQVYILFAVAIKLVTLAIYLQLDSQYIGYAWLLQSMGLFYIAAQIKNPVLSYAGLVVLALATLGISTWVDQDYIAISLIGEALGLALMGAKLNMLEVRLSSVGALALGSLYVIGNMVPNQLFNHEVFMLNWPTFSLMLSIIASSLIYFTYKNFTEPTDKLVLSSLGIGFLVLIFIFLTVENHHFFLLHEVRFFLSPEQLSLSVLWMVYAISLFLVGIKKNLKELRYGALGLIGISSLKPFSLTWPIWQRCLKYSCLSFLGCSY